MKHLIIILLLIGLTCTAYADETNRFGMYGELGFHQEPGVITSEIGVFAEPNEHVSTRVGIMLMASELLQRYYGGISAGIRLGTGAKFSPFIGTGIFLGRYKDPETDRIEDVIASWYPEAGFSYQITESFRLTAFAKYYYTSTGRQYDHAIYGLGIGLSF